MKKIILLMVFILGSCLVSIYQVHAQIHSCCLCKDSFGDTLCAEGYGSVDDCKNYCKTQGWSYVRWEYDKECHINHVTGQWECTRLQSFPTLKEWVLIVLALSVGGFFVWQLRRRKAAVSSQ
jgi:hypothetical protein